MLTQGQRAVRYEGKPAPAKVAPPKGPKAPGSNAQSEQMQKNLTRNKKEINVYGVPGTTGKQKWSPRMQKKPLDKGVKKPRY